jgi:hypothetical protein
MLTGLAWVFLGFSRFCGAEPAAVRPPAVAGQFYPADAGALSAAIEGFLAKAPSQALSGQIVAMLVPHAGITFSGATAARAFKLLKAGQWDDVIVIGTGHYKALNGAAIYPGAYSTPEGVMPYDVEMARKLAESTPLIKFDASAHDKEHSIEVEIPFLRHRLGSVKVVGLVMNTEDLESAKAIGHALALVSRGKKVLLVASSDQSHYPSGRLSDIVDRTTLEALKTMDPAYFWLTNRLLMNRGLKSLVVTYCGEGAVIAVMQAAKELGADQAKVLSHVNSGDVISEHDYNKVVGYAAVVFLKSGQLPAPAPLSGAQRKELLGLARHGIESYLSTGKMPAVALSGDPRLDLPGAVFVTLEKKSGELRGCIGSLKAQESLAESVVHNAVASAVSDSRFKPVEPAELNGLRIEISLLSQARPVAAAADIRKGDGVVVEEGEHSGVFLPQVWDELPDKDTFLGRLCSEKAGLPRDCYKDSMSKFKVFAVEIVRE